MIRYTNNLFLLKYLVEELKLSINTSTKNTSPLYLAIVKGKYDFVTYLINKNADPNHLQYSSYQSNDENSEENLDPDKYDLIYFPPIFEKSNGNDNVINALTLSVLSGHLDITKLLCGQVGMDVNVPPSSDILFSR